MVLVTTPRNTTTLRYVERALTTFSNTTNDYRFTFADLNAATCLLRCLVSAGAARRQASSGCTPSLLGQPCCLESASMRCE